MFLLKTTKANLQPALIKNFKQNNKKIRFFSIQIQVVLITKLLQN